MKNSQWPITSGKKLASSILNIRVNVTQCPISGTQRNYHLLNKFGRHSDRTSTCQKSSLYTQYRSIHRKIKAICQMTTAKKNEHKFSKSYHTCNRTKHRQSASADNRMNLLMSIKNYFVPKHSSDSAVTRRYTL